MKALGGNDDVAVSIILTAFNHEKYLARAIDGILMQEVDFGYEIIIGDDASTDGSASIVKDYANRYPEIVIPIFREFNIGGSHNFTDLFRRCRGNYLTFIDGDDFWLDNGKLQTQYDYLEAHPHVFSLTHSVRMCDSDGNEIGLVPSESYNDNCISIENVLHGRRFALTATMMRAIHAIDMESLLGRIEAGPRNAGDLSIALFLLDKGRIPIIDKVMSVYQYRSASGETNYNSITKLADRIRDRMTLLAINDQYYHGKYYFGLMYLRLAGTVARRLPNAKLSEFIRLAYLVLKNMRFFVVSTISYFKCGANFGR